MKQISTDEQMRIAADLGSAIAERERLWTRLGANPKGWSVQDHDRFCTLTDRADRLRGQLARLRAPGAIR